MTMVLTMMDQPLLSIGMVKSKLKYHIQVQSPNY